MTVICAWCRAEGKPGYLDERESMDPASPKQGACSRHQEQFLGSLPSGSFPEVEFLIVVHLNEPELYEYLQRSLAGVRGVKVIMDRRGVERRREPRPVGGDRRRGQRRIRQGKVLALGYTLVRFRPRPGKESAL